MKSKRSKIASPRGGRSVPEWIGKTPDSVPPPTVVARIFDTHHGICHITGVKIQPGDDWDADHIKRLADGGPNRESNMAPALVSAHKVKTTEETKRGRKADRTRRNHIGATPPPQNPMESRNDLKREKPKREFVDPNPGLPRRAMFKDAM